MEAAPLAQRLRDFQGMRQLATMVAIDQLVYHPACYFPVFYTFQEILHLDPDGALRDVLGIPGRAFESWKKNVVTDLKALWCALDANDSNQVRRCARSELTANSMPPQSNQGPLFHGATEGPRSHSFCSIAMHCDQDVFVVRDAATDPTFQGTCAEWTTSTRHATPPPNRPIDPPNNDIQ